MRAACWAQGLPPWGLTGTWWVTLHQPTGTMKPCRNGDREERESGNLREIRTIPANENTSGWAWQYMPVVPATLEAEAGGSLKPWNDRLAWATDL